MILRVFVDANVLYSRTLRDWIFLLKLNGSGNMFQLHCTEDVLAEALYHLRRDHPKWRGFQTSSIRQAMVDALDEIVTDFDPTIDYPGADPNDRHVHAAAVACRADILVTGDQGLLNMPDQSSLPYEIYSPDEFFVQVDDSSPLLVMRVTEEQRVFWAAKKRHKGLVVALEKAGCPQFGARVQKHLKTLSGVKA